MSINNCTFALYLNYLLYYLGLSVTIHVLKKRIHISLLYILL